MTTKKTMNQRVGDVEKEVGEMGIELASLQQTVDSLEKTVNIMQVDHEQRETKEDLRATRRFGFKSAIVAFLLIALLVVVVIWFFSEELGQEPEYSPPKDGVDMKVLEQEGVAIEPHQAEPEVQAEPEAVQAESQPKPTQAETGSQLELREDGLLYWR